MPTLSDEDRGLNPFSFKNLPTLDASEDFALHWGVRQSGEPILRAVIRGSTLLQHEGRMECWRFGRMADHQGPSNTLHTSFPTAQLEAYLIEDGMGVLEATLRASELAELLATGEGALCTYAFGSRANRREALAALKRLAAKKHFDLLLA